MSRKLDALFEEKVLGVTFNDSANPFRMMPNYTTSLDAAWAGVEKICDDNVYYHARLEEVPGKSREWMFMFFSPIHSPLFSYSTASTPALALVKACLLAVGVTQEEIDGCE